LKVSCIYPDLAYVRKTFHLPYCQYLPEGSQKQMASLEASMICPTVNGNCIKNGELEPGLWSMQGQENKRYVTDREGGGIEKRV
jgi:hypothetical protein